MKKNKVIFVMLVILSMSIAACGNPGNSPAVTPEAVPTVIADDTIIAEGRVEPSHYAAISFNASGRVDEVLVKEGQLVKEGDPLIRLGDESDTNYAAALLELASAQKAYDDLINSRGSDFAQAVITLKDTQEEFDKADDYLKFLKESSKVPQTENKVLLVQTRTGYEYVYKTKSFKGPAPEDWIIEATNDLALKKAALENAQRTYDNLKDGPDAEELPLLEARLNAAKAGVAAFSVNAPFDGMITELDAKTGGSINAGEQAVVIADVSNWTVVTTDVTEIDVVKLSEGQPVSVTLDAIPGEVFKGEVLSIGQNYTENQGDIVYEVTVVLKDPSPDMRWGMTAAVKFE
jgi:HlyD family secretion protein